MKNTLHFVSLLFLAIFINSCSEEDTVPEVDCTESGLSVSATDIIEASCNEGGEVTFVATGGQAPYTYSLDGINFIAATNFINIPEGTYVGRVKDKNNCTAETSNIVINAAEGAISYTVVQNEPAGCSTSNGQITINATGGTGNLEYSVDGGTPTEENVFSSLSTGLHEILVSDEEGCENSQTVHVASGVSWSSTIEGQSESIMNILTTNCAGSGTSCHIGSTVGLPDWSNVATARAHAADIKRKTGDRSMPEDGELSQEQIDLIACWVDDGAKNN